MLSNRVTEWCPIEQEVSVGYRVESFDATHTKSFSLDDDVGVTMSAHRSNEDKHGVKIATKYYEGWVEQNVPDQTGKVAIVTGANSGIGFWIARALASKGCQVILACRDIGKGAAARNDIIKDFPDAHVHCMLLDLMDFSWVRAFCAEFLERYDALNYLINNAGVMAVPAGVSIDGHDVQMQTNHMGHFLLTKLLWKRLVDSPGQSRVIQHSCIAQWINSPVFNRDKYPHYSSSLMQGRFMKSILGYRPIDQWMRYGVTKLANLLFMESSNERLTRSNYQTKLFLSLHMLASHPPTFNYHQMTIYPPSGGECCPVKVNRQPTVVSR